METIRVSRISFVSSILVSSLVLTACGGGGGGGAESAASTTSPPGATSPATPSAPGGSANNAPSISGSASTAATAGVAYAFTPKATDADQDKVTFTIANKPAWATFVAATGTLTGTPGATDVGAYSNIEIAATDGKDVTALPAFSITVSPGVAKSAVSIAWDPPTQNDDGTALTDLKGYKIHYGTSSRAYTGSVSVDNPGLTSYMLESLPAGTHYIAMTAYNAAGEESEYSAEVTARFN